MTINKKFLIIWAVFLVALFFSIKNALAWEARVVHVSDGDTIHIEPVDGGDRVKVRLYGIDCPESKQPHGSVATGFVFDVALFRTVEVDQYDIDRYGRSVSVIWLPDGVNLNRELLRLGHAWYYEQYCKQDFCSEWQGVENEARESGRGLWWDGGAVAPWDWRKGVK